MQTTFNKADIMPYAEAEKIQKKFLHLSDRLLGYLQSLEIDPAIFFTKGETVYIPDLHGDFVHLMQVLHRHDLLINNLELKKNYRYVFLGDFYDRSPDSDVIDYWLNRQIKNNIEIYRLIGNHELAFFLRDKEGYPTIFPSQDSIKDTSNKFQVTENLLKNVAEGKIIAAFADKDSLYVHSYIINDDFLELELDIGSDIELFAEKLNKRFMSCGQEALDLYLTLKKTNKIDWDLIRGKFERDPLFNISQRKDDIHTSFIWRRTGLARLKMYPVELDVDIPDNVYQIVGHTPVFSFRLPKYQESDKPFVLSCKNGNGKVQFSDVGIGYYYKSDDFVRPKVIINKKFSIVI